MPYENEFASYRPLGRIAESESVRSLLRKSKPFRPTTDDSDTVITPIEAPSAGECVPDLVVAIDGSHAEVDVKNGYPGAKVGYCTVASVLLNLGRVNALDENRPVDPALYRETEESSTIDAALPGSNVVTRDHVSARDSFREAIYDILEETVVDEEDRASLLDTYEELLSLKPESKAPACPYEADECDQHFLVGPGLASCHCDRRRAIYSTDALRIHERFHDTGTNGEALGEVMQVWERLLLVHMLRCFERREWLPQMGRLAFVVDGPLALFGHPAWLSAAISSELKRINAAARSHASCDLLIVGVEKGGAFVEHFNEIDQTEEPGEELFPPRTVFVPSDAYIKKRIIYSDSPKRYGKDTYFGRKLFYKTSSGARIVATTPFLWNEQDNLDPIRVELYTQLGPTCALLDRLVSSRFPNALSPIISAHAHAAIPLNLGAKVLQQLARALMRDEV